MKKYIIELMKTIGITLTEEQESQIGSETKGTHFFPNEEALTTYNEKKKTEWTTALEKANARKDLINKALDKAGIKAEMKDDFKLLAKLDSIEDDAEIEKAISEALKARPYYKSIGNPNLDENQDEENKPGKSSEIFDRPAKAKPTSESLGIFN